METSELAQQKLKNMSKYQEILQELNALKDEAARELDDLEQDVVAPIIHEHLLEEE